LIVDELLEKWVFFHCLDVDISPVRWERPQEDNCGRHNNVIHEETSVIEGLMPDGKLMEEFNQRWMGWEKMNKLRRNLRIDGVTSLDSVIVLRFEQQLSYETSGAVGADDYISKDDLTVSEPNGGRTVTGDGRWGCRVVIGANRRRSARDPGAIYGPMGVVVLPKLFTRNHLGYPSTVFDFDPNFSGDAE
jgi:hypothetical protein